MLKSVLLPIIGIIIFIAFITGYRLLRLQMSVTSNRKYWEKQALSQPEPEDFVYVALGDSAAQAIGASEPLKGYVGLVAEYVHQKTGKNVHIINLSVSEAKLKDVIDTQPDELKTISRIDLITIEAGANDVPTFNEANFTAQFTELINALPKGTIVADIPSFKGGRKSSLRNTSKQAADIAATAIASRSDVYHAQLFNKTDQQGLSDFATDLFHPNDKGYQNWAAAFIEAIESALIV